MNRNRDNRARHTSRKVSDWVLLVLVSQGDRHAGREAERRGLVGAW